MHTVDEGILDNIFPLIKNQQHDIIIAHFLGVDHAGHRYGPSHSEMTSKLEQINSFLVKLFQDMDNDTIVFVLGDHGMDERGDHGGDSEQEMSTTLFAYSKKPFISTDLKKNMLDYAEKEKFAHLGVRTIQQIDFTPTFAALLGLPIPSSSLGIIIPEILGHKTMGRTTVTEFLLFNIQRIVDFVTKDQGTSELAQAIREKASRSQSHYIESLYKCAYEIVATVKANWAQFNLPRIYLGATILIVSLMYNLIDAEAPILPNFWILGVTSAFVSPDRIFPVVLIAYHVYKMRPNLLQSIISMVKFVFSDPVNALFFASYIFHISMSGSDSFTYNEEGVVHVLQQICTLSVLILGKSHDRLASGLMLLFARLVHSFTVCRAERVCEITFYEKGSSIVPLWILAPFLLAYAVAHFHHRKYLSGLERKLLILANISACLYWAIDAFEARGILVFKKTNVASLTYALISALFCVIVQSRRKTLKSQRYPRAVIPFVLLLTFLQKPPGAIVLILFFFQLECIKKLSLSWPCQVILAYLCAHSAFFGTGHQTTISSIHWDMAFIGIEKVNWIISPVLVALNTFGSFVLLALILPLIAPEATGGFTRSLILGLITVSVIVTGIFLRRHLMVWSVFTPKMLYTAMMLIAFDISSLLTDLLSKL